MRELFLSLLRYSDCLSKLAVDLGEDAVPMEELEEEVDEDEGVCVEFIRYV